MRIDGHPAAVVDHGQAVADVEDDLDPRRMAGDGLVHAVVDDFGGKVMECPLVGAADIHAGAAADRFEPFQYLDLRGVVAVGRGLVAVEQIVTHAMAIRGRQGRWQARFFAASGQVAGLPFVAFSEHR